MFKMTLLMLSTYRNKTLEKIMIEKYSLMTQKDIHSYQAVKSILGSFSITRGILLTVNSPINIIKLLSNKRPVESMP